MIREFLRGMGTISLFPTENDAPTLPKILSNEEAFDANLKAIASDMWEAIKIIKKEHPEFK